MWVVMHVVKLHLPYSRAGLVFQFDNLISWIAAEGCAGIGQDITADDSPCYYFVGGDSKPSATENRRIAGECCCTKHGFPQGSLRRAGLIFLSKAVRHDQSITFTV